MPYIHPIEREDLDRWIHELRHVIKTEGDLNYTITRLVHDWVQITGVSYATYNAAIGVLECAKLELYRRKVAPYEDLKITENGDV